jgi:ABC-2 type transport system permease protein
MLIMLRDKGALAVLFLLPLLFATINGAASQTMMQMLQGSPEGEDPVEVTAYLVNSDAGEYGAIVAGALETVSMLNLIEADSVEWADQQVAEGKQTAAIVIPADFSEMIDASEPTRVLVIADPAQEIIAGIITGIVNQAVAEVDVLGELRYGIRAVLDQAGTLEGATPELRQAAEAQTLGVLWTAVQEMRLAPVIEVKSEDLAGQEIETDWNPFGFTIPSFAVMFAFFLVGFIAERLLLEKEGGALRRLLASPIRRGSIIGGKMLAYVALVFLQFIVMFSVGMIFFDMPLGDSFLGLFLLTLATALAAVTLGLMIGALSKTSGQAGNLGTVLGFILMAVGGCLTPWFRGEGFMATLSRLTPHAWALDGYMKLMLDGLGLVDVLVSIVALIGFAAIFFLVAMWRFKFES